MSKRNREADLELATMEALRGAHDVRNRLLVEMSVGSPAIADIAYAIKVRIKEDYKIISKVKQKRDKRPAYSVVDITDIVGLRIVTLYRLDTLTIVPVLLDKIFEAEDSPSSLFAKGCVKELIIYNANPTGDPQALCARLMQYFETRKLNEIAKVNQTESNYSSIHMVTLCRGKYANGYRDIPVEIQIRTAFEDAWGEIDHKLKYKRGSAEIKGNTGASDQGRIQNCLSHLNVLKTMIDGIAQYADQIKVQMDEIDRDPVIPDVIAQAEDPKRRIYGLRNIPDDLRERLNAAVDESRVVLTGRRGGLSDDKTRFKRISELDEQLKLLLKEVDGAELSQRARKEVEFVLGMQRALGLYEMGSANGGSVRLLAEAVKIYADLERRLPRRPVIKYRLARALLAIGDKAAAKAKLKELIEGIRDDKGLLAAGHWIRAAAPRQLGFILWRDSIRSKQGNDGSATEVQRALLREAIAATEEAYGVEVSPELDTDPPERAKAANNLLYYVIEYLKAGGSARSIKFSKQKVQSLLDNMGVSDPAQVSDRHILDTAAVAYDWLGDSEKAEIARARLSSLPG